MSVAAAPGVDRETWETCADAYAGLFPRVDFYMALVHDIDRRLPDEGRLLDVGCGPGVLLESLHRPGRTVHGLDASESMLDRARERLPKEVELRRGDAANLPYPDAWFDGVSASNLLCFFDDPSPVTNEIHRVLKPGGTFVTTGPLPTCSIRTLVKVARQDLRRKGVLDEYEEALERTLGVGYEVEEGTGFRVGYTSRQLGEWLVDEGGFRTVLDGLDGVYAGQNHLVEVRR